MRWLVALLLCSTVAAPQTAPPIIRLLNAGEGERALTLGRTAEERWGRIPFGARLVFDGVDRYLQGKGGDKAEAATIGKLIDLVVRIGDKLAQEKDAGAEHFLLRARARCMAARWKARRGEADWPDAWRAAAQGLVAFKGEGAPRLHARAVAILCEAARQEGAPAEKLLAEARALAGEPRSAPDLALQLGLARYEWASKRKQEAEAALAPFGAVHDTLEKSEDLARLTVYNDAVAFAKANKLARNLEFIMVEHDVASLRFAVPRSYRWVLDDPSDNGVTVLQRTPGGSLRREVKIFNFPKDAPASDPNMRAENNKTRARAWVAAAEGHLVKIKRKARPRSGRISRSMSGAVIDVAGWEGDLCPQSRFYFFFRGKRMKKSFGEILVSAFGEGAEDDPDAAAFLASFVDK